MIYVVSDVLSPSSRAATGAPRPGDPRGDPAPEMARTIGEIDADAIVDLVGMHAALGPLLAQWPARSAWTYPALAAAHVAPLITHTLPPLEGDTEEALARHRPVLEAALQDACAAAPWFGDVAAHSASELAARWRAAVGAHQSGDAEAAIAAYRELLVEQPGYAPAQHLLGVLLRDRGQRSDAADAFAAALVAAPAYAESRTALANLRREDGLSAQAVKLCTRGLGLAPNDVSLWRALGMARLAQYDGVGARRAFARALEIQPGDATTHYNIGVALQMLHRRDPALHPYQRALSARSGVVRGGFDIERHLPASRVRRTRVSAVEGRARSVRATLPRTEALVEDAAWRARLGAWFK